MIRERGNMWSIFKHTDYFIVTTNSYIREDGALVMGRGAARMLKNRVKGIEYDFGSHIVHLYAYGLVIPLPLTNHKPALGAFQVKTHYMNDAKLYLIEMATVQLLKLSEAQPTKRFDMNFPGIGNGRLLKEDVSPIIQNLPDNVHIWSFT